jgi:tetratricopeptide (TPR) repeat protein
VISTLWRVNDLSATLMTLRFYWEWRHEKMPGPLALARAQWWQRSTTGEEKCTFIEQAAASGVLTRPAADTMTAEIRRRSSSAAVNPFSHPHHWAAFTYAGRSLSAGGDATGVHEQPNTLFNAAAGFARREQDAVALAHQGGTLHQQGRPEDAIAVYDQVVARFGDAAEPKLRQLVAMGLSRKGDALGELGRPEEAAAAYDQVVVRLASAAEPALREQMAAALASKWRVCHNMLDRPDAEIEVCDQILAWFGDAPESALREMVAQALAAKCRVFLKLARWEDAVKALDEIVALFGAAPERSLREQADLARSTQTAIAQRKA